MQAAALLVLLLSALLPAPAQAHAVLVASVPANHQLLKEPPAEIKLHFNEAVKILRASARFANDTSVELEAVGSGADIALRLPSVSRGTVIASYRVVSEDGHPVGGTVVFHVGAASTMLADGTSETTSFSLTCAIWLVHLASIVFVAHNVGGRLFFAAFSPSDAGIERPVTTGIIGVALFGLGLYLHGLDEIGSGLAFAGATPLLTAIGTKVAIANGLFLAAVFIGLLTPFRPSARRLAAALTAIGLASAAFAFSGHSALATPSWLAKTCILLHGGILLFWIGSLPPLWRLCRQPSDRMPLRSFSAAIPIPFVGMLVAGLTLAVLELPDLSSIWASIYGRVLLAKIVLVGVLCALAAYNRFYLTTPAIKGDVQACLRLRRSITAELVLAVAIVGTASLWRFAGPDQVPSALPPPLSIHIHTDKAMAQFELAPKSPDAAAVDVTILASDFAPMHPKAVTLRLWNPALGIEAMKYALIGSGAGRWTAENIPYRSPRGWKVDLQVLIDDFTTAHLETDLDDGIEADGSASGSGLPQ